MRINKILLAILIVAAIYRFVGIKPGFPPYHPDEGMSYAQGISIIIEGKFDANGYPLHYAYPYLIPLINFILFKFFFIPISWFWYFISNLGKIADGVIHLPMVADEYRRVFRVDILGERELNVLWWGRYVTALFGVGVTLLTYLATKELFKKITIALLAAFYVAVNFRQVLNSHIGLPDIYNAFFLAASFWMSVRLFQTKTTKNLFLASLACGLSVTTKFQFFALPPLIVAIIWGNRMFPLRSFTFSLLIISLITMIVNPYHLINFEKTFYILRDVSLKYSPGNNQIYFYPYYYLYNFGLGKALAISSLLGLIIMALKDSDRFLLIFSLLGPFLYVISYYSKGGFYTRNLIPIIPIFLISSAYFLIFLFDKVRSKLNPTLAKGILAILIVISSYSNIANSTKVVSAYSDEWNFKKYSIWMEKNIPKGSKISANNSVWLPVDRVVRLRYDLDHADSINEFSQDGADFAVFNSDWQTNSFYWWMSRTGSGGQAYLDRPTKILEQTYEGMSARELTDFTIYKEVNFWQAPDSNLIVAKIPKLTASYRDPEIVYSFTSGDEGWVKRDETLQGGRNLFWRNGALGIGNDGAHSEISHWESPVIDITKFRGLVVDSAIKIESENTYRDGVIFVNFYHTWTDAETGENRVAVRLSPRPKEKNSFQPVRIISQVPAGAKFIKIGFITTNSATNLALLKNVKVYAADVKTDFGGFDSKPFTLDTNVLFPISHGNL